MTPTRPPPAPQLAQPEPRGHGNEVQRAAVAAELRWYLSGEWSGDLGLRSNAGSLVDYAELGARVQTSGPTAREPSSSQMRAAARVRAVATKLRALDRRRRAGEPTLEQVLRRAYGPVVLHGRGSLAGIDPEAALRTDAPRSVRETAPLVGVMCLLPEAQEAKLEAGSAVSMLTWLRALTVQVLDRKGDRARLRERTRLLEYLVGAARVWLAEAEAAYANAGGRSSPQRRVPLADLAEGAAFLGMTRRRLRVLVGAARFRTVRRARGGWRIGWCCLRRERTIRAAVAAAGVGRKGLDTGVVPCECEGRT